MTVTFQPTRPSKPTILRTEKKQLNNGIKTHNMLLKTSQSVAIIKRNTPAPKTIETPKAKYNFDDLVTKSWEELEALERGN